jgi:hypothetical protein
MLEESVCQQEYAIAKKTPVLQNIVPLCETLPPAGSKDSENCLRLGVPNVVQVVRGNRQVITTLIFHHHLYSTVVLTCLRFLYRAVPLLYFFPVSCMPFSVRQDKRPVNESIWKGINMPHHGLHSHSCSWSSQSSFSVSHVVSFIHEEILLWSLNDILCLVSPTTFSFYTSFPLKIIFSSTSLFFGTLSFFLFCSEHTCYAGNGIDYRGTASRTKSGVECGPWNRIPFHRTVDHPELIGGHNFCRNPGSLMSQPFCYLPDMKKHECEIPRCSECHNNICVCFLS